MSDFWHRFWNCKDVGFLIAASLSGMTGYLLIGLWALQRNDPFAFCLTLLGVSATDASYRLMGVERDREYFSRPTITLAVASWLLPFAAVAYMVFTPTTGPPR